MDGEVIFRLSQARLGYGTRVILEGVNLEVTRGDFLGIVGPNGSGKTTILKTMLGLLDPMSGSVERRMRAGYAPQRRALDTIYPLMAREVVGMGLLGPRRLSQQEEQDRVARAL